MVIIFVIYNSIKFATCRREQGSSQKADGNLFLTNALFNLSHMKSNVSVNKSSVDYYL